MWFHSWFILTLYYKMSHTLLQNATTILLQNTTKVDYMRQLSYYKMQQFYSKMQQLLQNETILSKKVMFLTKCVSITMTEVNSAS